MAWRRSAIKTPWSLARIATPNTCALASLVDEVLEGALGKLDVLAVPKVWH